jgi:hypothetical protein
LAGFCPRIGIIGVSKVILIPKSDLVPLPSRSTRALGGSADEIYDSLFLQRCKMIVVDWPEVSKILLTSIASALFTGILAFTAQKLFIERKLLKSLELFKAELQKVRDQEARQLSYVERQLEEFYSPMVGCLRKIKAKSNLRYEISQISDIAWREICEARPQPFLDHEKYFEPFHKTIEYDNKQLQDEIIPLYDQMLTIFTQKYWLAYPSTRQWYPQLTTFVELWNRWLNHSIPVEVIKKMDHSEVNLQPFYDDLEKQLNELHKKLAGE